MSDFKQPALKELTHQQVRFAPPGRRLEQLARAEKLLAEVEPGRRYPYQFVCYRVTDYRPETYPGLLIPGDELAHDLRLLIGALAERAESKPAQVPTHEDVLTLEQVSQRFNVSTKTIRRWRKFGLVGQPFLQDGKRHIGFTEAVVRRFLENHSGRVERGGKFSQLGEEEKEEIVRRGRRLAQAGGSLTEVSRRIGRRLGRSAETVRYTLKNFDRDNPDQALFPNLTGPLDAQTKETIYSSYRQGIAVDTLAKRFQRTRTSMYRVINEVRAQHLLDQPIDYIANPEFDDPSKEAEILAPMPEAEDYEAKRRQMRAPKDVQPELTSCYEMPLLAKKQEAHLFRQMNFLKHQAARLRDGLRKDKDGRIDPTRVRIQTLKDIEDLLTRAGEVKQHLINANMRLVVSVAKKHAHQADNFFELVSDGNMSLIRAVEKFDYGRGFKFSTYASWAIMKNYARSIPDEKHRRERFLTGHEDVFDVAPDNRTDEHEMLATQERATFSVNRLLEYLEPREREIIRMRAGLDDHAKGMTLEEIGQQFGITKERVRQLNARAMKKLKAIAEDHEFDI